MGAKRYLDACICSCLLCMPRQTRPLFVVHSRLWISVYVFRLCPAKASWRDTPSNIAPSSHSWIEGSLPNTFFLPPWTLLKVLPSNSTRIKSYCRGHRSVKEDPGDTLSLRIFVLKKAAILVTLFNFNAGLCTHRFPMPRSVRRG